MILRAARLDDTDACAAILGGFFEAEPWLPRLHTSDEDRAFMRAVILRGGVTVAVQHDLIGFCACDGSEISHLFVAAHARRRGVGRQFLDHAKRGQGRLTLWCFQQNTPALAFYADAGFTEIAQTDGQGNEEQLPDVQLEWRAR